MRSKERSPTSSELDWARLEVASRLRREASLRCGGSGICMIGNPESAGPRGSGIPENPTVLLAVQPPSLAASESSLVAVPVQWFGRLDSAAISGPRFRNAVQVGQTVSQCGQGSGVLWSQTDRTLCCLQSFGGTAGPFPLPVPLDPACGATCRAAPAPTPSSCANSPTLSLASCAASHTLTL